MTKEHCEHYRKSLKAAKLKNAEVCCMRVVHHNEHLFKKLKRWPRNPKVLAKKSMQLKRIPSPSSGKDNANATEQLQEPRNIRSTTHETSCSTLSPAIFAPYAFTHLPLVPLTWKQPLQILYTQQNIKARTTLFTAHNGRQLRTSQLSATRWQTRQCRHRGAPRAAAASTAHRTTTPTVPLEILRGAPDRRQWVSRVRISGAPQTASGYLKERGAALPLLCSAVHCTASLWREARVHSVAGKLLVNAGCQAAEGLTVKEKKSGLVEHGNWMILWLTSLERCWGNHLQVHSKLWRSGRHYDGEECLTASSGGRAHPGPALVSLQMSSHIDLIPSFPVQSEE